MTGPARTPGRADLLALFAITATLLAYEVAITRLIAVQHWHHLTHLVIAVALLGFGAAGVVTTLGAARVRARPGVWLVGSGLVLALWLPVSVALSQLVPLNMAALPWQNRQIGYLLVYAVVFLPGFLAGATLIAVYFMLWPGSAGRVYAADLLGSATGALAVLFVIDALDLTAAFGVGGLLAAAATGWLGYCLGRRRWLGVVAGGAAALLVVAGWSQLDPRPAAYKSLAVKRLERGAETLVERDGLRQRLTVLAGPGAHAAPGLSVNSDRRAPPQWSLFFDGEQPTPLLKPGGLAAGWARHSLGGAPYRLVDDPERVLVADATALWHAWLARDAGADRIDVTTADADTADLLRQLRDQQGGGVVPDGVALRHAATRRFLEATRSRYDVQVLTIGSPDAGIASAQEDYLLTRQGLARAFERLAPDGVLAVFVELNSVPRETLRLVATLRSVLAERGLNPSAHTAVLRDWRKAAVLVGRQPLSDEQTRRLRAWAEEWHFDIAALPGLGADEVNRFHRRQQGYYTPVQRLLGERAQAFRDSYVFDLTPPTDDRPFFFRFFRWSKLDHLQQTAGPRWRQFIGWGYLLSLAALVVGTALAAVLLTVPRLIGGVRPRVSGLPLFRYFLFIGLGFMLLQIALLQKAALLLDATSLAMSVVLAAMLAGAGLGSLGQQRVGPGANEMRWLAGVLAVAALAAPCGLGVLFQWAAGWPLLGRIAVVAVLVGVVALPMGVFLPYAFQRLAGHQAETIAWAWAVNGFASVLGTLAAGLIAMHAGFTVVGAAAALCYVSAACLVGRFVDPA